MCKALIFVALSITLFYMHEKKNWEIVRKREHIPQTTYVFQYINSDSVSEGCTGVTTRAVLIVNN